MSGYSLLRGVGFLLDPERAHRLALRWHRVASPLRRRAAPGEPVELMGLSFRNRIGLAAGYDKNGTAWRGLARLGFGHIEVGTVTLRPQPGNARPRLERFPDQRALVNRLGFPSDGAAVVAARLAGRRGRGCVLGVSIGPNADAVDDPVPDLVEMVQRFAPVADYLAVNISSPNTKGLRSLEGAEAAHDLVAALAAARDRVATRPPALVVKISPDLADPEATAAGVAAAGADGLVVANTTVARPPGWPGDLGGGLSGAPLASAAVDALRRVRAAVPIPIIASGGVMSAADAAARIDDGADLVQLYTGFVYGGPKLVRTAATAAGHRGSPGGPAAA